MERNTSRWCPHYHVCAGEVSHSGDASSHFARTMCENCDVRIRVHAWELESYIKEDQA